MILEESSAERIIRDFIVPWILPGLARVRFLSAGGVSAVPGTFEEFRRLFLFAHLEAQYFGRAWTVTDGDEAGIAIRDQLRASYKSWPADTFLVWSKPNFEDYYPSRFSQAAVEALSKHDKKSRREAKKRLFDEVVNWLQTAPRTEAEAELRESAAEVIDVLIRVQQVLAGGGSGELGDESCAGRA